MEPASESQTLQLPSAERVTATKVTRGIDTELDLDDSSSVVPRVTSSGSTDSIVRDYNAPNGSRWAVDESHGSVVYDAGFSFEPAIDTADQPPSQTQALQGLGTQFDHSDTILDHFFTKEGKKVTNADPEFIATWLRNKREEPGDREDSHFIPINQRMRVMTYRNIYEELLRAGMPEEELVEVTLALCRRRKDSLQRIFAILCMLDSPVQIKTFMEEKIFDEHLPFSFREGSVYRRTSQDQSRFDDPIRVFQGSFWKAHLKDTFDMYQKQMSAPFFQLSWTANETIFHYSLKDSLVLPFMRVESPVDDTQNSPLAALLTFQGGTSIVRKVKIHPAHHTPDPDINADPDACFAIKQLQDEPDWKQNGMTMQEYEVRALRRLNPQQDVHLIRLLATYEYRGHFHLILPWADGGNLQNLWKACHPQVSSEPRDPTVARWMSVQILGLARALQKIHYCRMDRNDINSLSPNGKVQEYGRHGDLKPENILWFKGNTRSVTSEEAKFGTLKIADFGFADFHSKHSKSDVHRSAVGGYTQTYSAPEFDVTQSISPQYDIWSFGCILMQFVVWYLEGWQGVDKFSKERSQDRKGALVPTDQFFRLETRTSTGFNARAKGSVVDKFQRLKEDLACSDYILDLLQCVEEYMLRVNKDKRAEIDVVVEKFDEMHRCCMEDSRYCISRTKAASRSLSGLSEIAEVPNSLEREAIVDVPLPDLMKQRMSYASDLVRRSPPLSGRQNSIASSSRQSSRTSFISSATARPMSNLGSYILVHTDHGNPVSDIVNTPAGYNTLATSNPEGLESMHRVHSNSEQAPSMIRETNTGSSTTRAAQPLSERSRYDIASSSDRNADGNTASGIWEEPNTKDSPNGFIKPQNVGNGTTGTAKVPKDPASKAAALALQEPISELPSAHTSGVRNDNKLTQRWKSMITKLSCF